MSPHFFVFVSMPSWLLDECREPVEVTPNFGWCVDLEELRDTLLVPHFRAAAASAAYGLPQRESEQVRVSLLRVWFRTWALSGSGVRFSSCPVTNGELASVLSAWLRSVGRRRWRQRLKFRGATF